MHTKKGPPLNKGMSIFALFLSAVSFTFSVYFIRISDNPHSTIISLCFIMWAGIMFGLWDAARRSAIEEESSLISKKLIEDLVASIVKEQVAEDSFMLRCSKCGIFLEEDADGLVSCPNADCGRRFVSVNVYPHNPNDRWGL